MSPSKLARLQASEARQQKKQKRKAEEGQLQAKRQEMDKAKVCYICVTKIATVLELVYSI